MVNTPVSPPSCSPLAFRQRVEGLPSHAPASSIPALTSRPTHNSKTTTTSHALSQAGTAQLQPGKASGLGPNQAGSRGRGRWERMQEGGAPLLYPGQDLSPSQWGVGMGGGGWWGDVTKAWEPLQSVLLRDSGSPRGCSGVLNGMGVSVPMAGAPGGPGLL